MGCCESQGLRQSAVGMASMDRATPCETVNISQSIPSRTVKDFREHYKLLSVLGFGSCSKVFKARHYSSGQLRAVKIIEMPQFTITNSRRVWRQFQVLRSLDHAHIIKAYESFTDRGRYYSVLELCQGQLIKSMLTQELSPTNPWLSRIMRQLLSAVNFCHKQGIIHRNIRPECILLASQEGWNIKLAGFVYALKRPQLLIEDEPIISPFHPPAVIVWLMQSCFMAPECEKLGYSEKSDVWACGMFLYLLVTGGIETKCEKRDRLIHRRSACRSLQAFNRKQLDSIDSPSRQLLKWMLEISYSKRPTAEECLAHPFFTNTPPITSVSRENINAVVDRLRSFHVQSVLQHFIMMYNCHHLATLKQKDQHLAEFDCIDTNSDGYVTKEQLYNALVRFGVDKTEAQQQTNQLFERIDMNCNGVIDYSEYVMATLLSDRRVSEADLQSMFRLINTNNAAVLPLQDIAKALDKRQNDRFVKELGRMSQQPLPKAVDLGQFKAIMMALLKSKGRLTTVDG